jgi:tetratricopeptide (TPR) repeat protein
MACETWREGEAVGDWVIVRHLARGGMDDVYEAAHRDTGERVAIKSPRGDDPVARGRFERGARLALSLAHPRIVAARALGRRGDAPYLALELLRGEDLGRRLRRGPLAAADAVAVAAQACDALAFAHARRVVHRDVTPANLFLCEGPAVDVRVLDFGLARAEGSRTLSSGSHLVGTLPYLSPEQVTNARDLDGRSDLWSLGVVLYQCLSGALPFEADSAYGTLWQIVTAAPAPLAPRCPGAPGPLLDVVARALRRDRGERFASAAEMRDALHRALASGAAPAATRPPDAWLSAVACAREPRDVPALTRAAEALGASALHLAQEQVFFATFGRRRWLGDEPRLAAEFAAGALRFARGVGVATGRPGGAHDVAARAAALARSSPGRVALDDDTARMTGERAVSQALPRPAAHVARAAELALLLGAAAAARAQAIPRAVVVLAQQGLGKSRLLREAVARADAPPAPLVVACEAAHRDAPLAALDALLGAPAAAPDGAPADPQVPLDRARAALSAALGAGGVAALCVDDAQWLDAASREVIRRVYEEAEAPFALWLFATPEARAGLCALCPDAAVCELAPLSPADARALLQGVAPGLPAATAEAIVERAEGHPLFLESLAHWRAERRDDEGDELPATVQAVFQSLLHRMGGEAREFLRCASVFGRTTWAEGAAALGASAGALATLRRAGHLGARASRVPGAAEFAFRSGLLRDVAYELWPEGDRPGRHRLAAAWLAAHPGERDEEIARHWDLAGDPARAGAHYAAAAERAARIAGPTAAEHAARALARASDPRVRWRALLARDTATQIDGDRARHAEGVAALEALAPELGVAEMAEAAWRRCYLCRVTARDAEARAAAALAIDLADGAGALRVAAQARVELALMDANEGRLASATDHAAAAESAARREGDPWLVARAQTTLGYVLNELGRAAEALGLFEAAVGAYARADDRRREAIALANSGAVLLRLGRTGESLERFASALELSRRVGNPSTVAVASQNLAALHRALGRYDLCRAELDEAERLARKLRRPRLDAALAIERAYLALAGGDPADALRAACGAALTAARAARSPLLVASAVAAALRAGARAGAIDGALRAEAEALRGELAAQAEAHAELTVALWEAGGASRAEVDAAVERFVAAAGDIDDPVACAEAFRRRYDVPT